MKKNRVYLFLILIIFTGSFLRLYRFTDVPAGLMQDEAVVYDAYSILFTGRDHHGASFPITFQSFNDWIAHVTPYLMIPSIKIFGLTPLAVRFPVALLSILSILTIFLLVKKLTDNNLFSLLVTALYSLSQFSIITSRWLISPNIVPFFIILDLFVFFSAINHRNNKSLLFIVSCLLFALTLYIYPSVEGMLPVFLIAVGLMIYIKRKEYNSGFKRNYLLLLLVFILISLPLLTDHLRRPETISNRLSMISVTNLTNNPFVTYFKNYLSYFLPSPLFGKGEINPVRAVPGFGYENTVLAPFYYLGLFILFFRFKFLKEKFPSLSKLKINIIRLFVILFPIVPSLTLPSGDFQRATHYLPVLFLTISIGVVYFTNTLNRIFLGKYKFLSFAIIAGLVLVYFYGQVSFYREYFGEKYRGISQWYFQYGLDKVIEYTGSNESKYQTITIDSTINQPYIYVLFYKKIDPKSLTDEDYRNFSRVDPQTNWLAVSDFRNFRFRKITDPDISGGKLIKTIFNSPYSNYSIYEKENNLIVKFEVTISR